MLTRRQLFQTVAGGISIAIGERVIAKERSLPYWFMPEEAAPHQRTWMAFGARASIWGNRLLPAVREDLARIANTIVQYEPVTLLVRKEEYDLAKKLVDSSVELMILPLDDIWIRDTGPVFVVDKTGNKAGIDFNFNGWGNKQPFSHDAQVARFIVRQAEVELIKTYLVLEGGSIEVDGQGTAVMTESCILNDNRNPEMSKAEVTERLSQLLGLNKIIWLPGVRGQDITDGHTDFYVRFVRPGVVLANYESDKNHFDHQVTKTHLEKLRAASDAQNQPLEVTTITTPRTLRYQNATADFAAGYMGFYICNGAVIMQSFGDLHTDFAAKEILQNAFPDREIVQLNVDAIAAGGGTIHCVTQQEPKAI